MLETLKINNWRQIPPFNFYLDPLDKQIKATRKRLLDMKMKPMGHLYMDYRIENNEALLKDIKDMIAKDVIAQYLVGDPLKQDQFKFFYETAKIIYDSALQSKFLSSDERVMDSVLP